MPQPSFQQQPAWVTHAGVRGRTRIAVDAIHRAPERARALVEALEREPGVRSVRADARTGKVLLHHPPDWDPAQALGVVTRVLPQAVDGSAAPAHPPGCAPPGPATPPAWEGPPSPWHALPVEAVVAALGADRRAGLDGREALARLRRFGRNAIEPPQPKSELSMLVEQFVSLPVAMLGGSMALSLATRSFFEAAVTGGVVVANAGIGYGTESGAQRLIERLIGADDLTATVVRDGREQRIPARSLVPGDIVVLRRGDAVPADARLLTTEALSVNESLLTGESIPQSKQAEAAPKQGAPLAERANMVFMGTAVSGGSGRALVVATGGVTEIGRIQRLVGTAEAPRTPMERDLDRLGRDLALGALAVCAAAFALGLLRRHPALHLLKSAIALAVAAVPEGLPAVATSTLALGLRRMRRKQLLVRRLDAVEGLGSVQTLCLDKTGTLTRNRMTVTAVTVDGERLSLQPFHQPPAGAVSASLADLAGLAVLAAEVPWDGDRTTPPELSGTEQALVDLARRAGVDLQALHADVHCLGTRARDERHNFVMVAYRTPEGPLLAVKGRPSEVLAHCESWRLDGEVLPLDDAGRHAIGRDNERLAAEGLRVLGVAYSRASSSLTPGEAGLVWCGLVALDDPVRTTSRVAIRELQRAGIRTVMITGDQGPTAVKVAEALDLSAGQPLRILDAADLDRLDPAVLSALAAGTHVFARVSPAQKLEIVQALQRAGQVVAMTGDGINDGPALKAADVGIAMGRQGSRIAKDVADVVIEDDDLEHLLVGVREGRTILANIRKAVHFLLATNLSEILVVFAEIVRGPSEVESPTELFWLNLVTDVFPSFGLALEPAAADVMEQAPRHRQEPLIDSAYYRRLVAEAGIIGLTTLGAHGYGLWRYGPGASTRGVTLLAMVGAQLLHALTCRTDRFHATSAAPLSGNPALLGALGISAALQALPFLFPPLRRLLGVAPLKPLDLAVAGGASAASYLANQWLENRGASP
jgi:Ca2+-transporting ATPase